MGMDNGITLKRYIRESKTTIICLGAVVLFLCVFRLVFQTIGYDTDEWMLTPETTLEHWLGIGRYSLVALKRIFGCSGNLYLLNTITYFNVFIYAIMLGWFFNINRNGISQKKDIICGVALVLSPIFLEQYYFTLQSAEVSFGMILMVLSFITTYKLLNTHKIIWGAVTVLNLVFCFGIYQSFANLYILGAVVCLYKLNEEDKKSNVKRIVACLVIFVLSICLYVLITNLSVAISGVPSSEYLSVGWMNQSFLQCCLTVIIVVGRVILGHGNVLNLSYTICAIYVLSKIWGGKSKISWNNFYLFSLLVVPFLLNVFMATPLAIRSIICIPVLCTFIYFEFLHEKKHFDIFIYLIIFSQAIHCVLLTYSDYVRYKEDISISEKIYSDCKADASTVIVFKGMKEREGVWSMFEGQAMGNSFYEWTNDNQNAEQIRVAYFMKLHGLNLTYPTDEQQEGAAKVLHEKSYPETGYIVKENGVYYVNLGTFKEE